MTRNHPIPAHPPVISCLMVTQQGRLDETRHAIDCFCGQLLQPLELIIVHDSSDAYHQQLLKLTKSCETSGIRIFQEQAGHTLGWLRNRSLEHARAGLICQWDDDDFNHPARLKTQYEMMQEENSDFCFMTDQLHLFTEQGYMFWDDRSIRPAPFDLIENTMLGQRDLMGLYPELERGEDTVIIKHIFKHQYKVSRLAGKGWLYTYVFNGKNTWDFDHHSAISFHQRFNTAELLTHEERLLSELKKYAFPFDHVIMPHDEGKIDFSL